MILIVHYKNEEPSFRKFEDVTTVSVYPNAKHLNVPELIIHFNKPKEPHYISLSRVEDFTVVQ